MLNFCESRTTLFWIYEAWKMWKVFVKIRSETKNRGNWKMWKQSCENREPWEWQFGLENWVWPWKLILAFFFLHVKKRFEHLFCVYEPPQVLPDKNIAICHELVKLMPCLLAGGWGRTQVFLLLFVRSFVACFNAGSLPDYCSDILTLPRSWALRQCKNGWLLLSCAQCPSCVCRMGFLCQTCQRCRRLLLQENAGGSSTRKFRIWFSPLTRFPLARMDRKSACAPWLIGWLRRWVCWVCRESCFRRSLSHLLSCVATCILMLSFCISLLPNFWQVSLVCVAENIKLYMMQVSKQHATSGEIHTVWPCCWHAMTFGVLRIWQRWQCCFFPSTEAALAVRRSRARMHAWYVWCVCGHFDLKPS